MSLSYCFVFPFLVFSLSYPFNVKSVTNHPPLFTYTAIDGPSSKQGSALKSTKGLSIRIVDLIQYRNARKLQLMQKGTTK